MAEKQTFPCNFCNLKYTHGDYILHQLYPPHSKRIKAQLLQGEFSAMCMVCMLGVKGLQEVQNHVNSQTHISNYSSRLSNTHTNTKKGMCAACGVAFYNELALEAHLLIPPHGSSTSPHFPKITAKTFPLMPNVDEVLKHLSGLPGEHFSLDVTCLCRPCDVIYDSLDDLILHMFTSTHISRLKLSKCIVCKKEFSHPVNSNDHIGSSKHHSTLQKCSNRLQEWRVHSRFMKGGFSCVYCMLWYSSWHCMELHLCSVQHAKALLQREGTKQGGLARQLVKRASISLDDGQGEVCDDSAISNWREWQEDERRQQAWCHRCGISVSSLDVGSYHLKEVHNSEGKFDTPESKHDDGLSCLAHRSQGDGEPMNLSFLPELFHCCVCALSFKSALLLSAHEACVEHHCRLELGWSSGLQYCASCGVVLRQTDSNRSRGDSQKPLPDDVELRISFLETQKSDRKQGALLVNAKFKNTVRFDLPNESAVIAKMPTKIEQNISDNAESHVASYHPDGVANAGGQSHLASSQPRCEAFTLEDPAKVFENKENPNSNAKAPIMVNRLMVEDENTICSLGKIDVASMHQQGEPRSITIGNSLQKGEGEPHAYEVAKQQESLGNMFAHLQHSATETLNTNFHSPIVVAQGITSFHTLSEALDTMLKKVGDVLLSTFPKSSQQPTQSNNLKHKSVDDEITKQHDAKRACNFHRRLHSPLAHDITPLADESCQDLCTTGFCDNDDKDSKALLLLSASILPPNLGGSLGFDVVEAQQGWPSVGNACNPLEHLSEELLRNSCEKLHSQHLQNTGMMGDAIHEPKFGGTASGHGEINNYAECCQILEDLKDTSDWWRLVSDLEDSTDSEMQM
ncbi:hypothetical protein GOP47_0027219 [Adiantum capillus-veneris]|nr:hypothetical protein GOP47_0027219 [Adiantum capillus-veneris]